MPTVALLYQLVNSLWILEHSIKLVRVFNLQIAVILAVALAVVALSASVLAIIVTLDV